MSKATSKPASEIFVYKIVSGVESRLEEKLEEKDKKDEERYSSLIEHLVDIAGKFKKFDEEQTILSASSLNHNDRLEKLEENAFRAS